MRKFLTSGALITAIGIWGALTTAAVTAVVLIGGGPALHPHGQDPFPANPSQFIVKSAHFIPTETCVNI